MSDFSEHMLDIHASVNREIPKKECQYIKLQIETANEIISPWVNLTVVLVFRRSEFIQLNPILSIHHRSSFQSASGAYVCVCLPNRPTTTSISTADPCTIQQKQKVGLLIQKHWSLQKIYKCVCECVRVRERERERLAFIKFLLTFCCSVEYSPIFLDKIKLFSAKKVISFS